jgi:hypothetical protein
LVISDAVGFPYARVMLEDGASARFGAVFGRLALCGGAGDLLGGRLSFCAGARAGALLIRTQGLDANARVHPPTAQAEISVRYEGLRAHRIGFYLALRFMAPVYAARPYYDRGHERRYYADPDPGLGGEFGLIFRPRS